ncbi:hypothetical protein O181_026775 [Austropuccinia psidii MF-1]|uniref:Uncharacterized protein n=1 Tax=Austropuccinia psidii MF-1 TaxID=1389203 RepID=A0A9Q3H2I3_9BASI|nr:hypothetical protein [Austropuccinia psidii MF-1]
MSTTQIKPVVCCCQSYGCSQLQFKDHHGKWQPGLIVSHGTKNKHSIVDAQLEMLLEKASLSSNDSGSSLLQSLQDSSSDNPNKASLNSSGNIDSQLHNLSTPPSSPNNFGRSNAYNCVAASFEPPMFTPADKDNSVVPGCFHTFSLAGADSMSLHVSLLIAILSIFDKTCISTSAWLLKLIRDLLALTASMEFNSTSTKKLKHQETKILDAILSDAHSIIRRLNIDPLLVQVVCCPHCFAMYPNNPSTPTHCIHQRFKMDHSLASGNEGSDSETQQYYTLPDGLRHICGMSLFQGSRCPIKTYAFQNLYDWLGRFFSHPEIEAALESSAQHASKPFNPNSEASDIHHSRMWKQFLGPDQTHFTKQSGNLTFGIAPGPKEPSLEEVNWILRPIVEQIKVLWDPGLLLSQTHKYPQGHQIFAPILPFFADLPALCCALGFAAPTANCMCLDCFLKKSEINNLDPQTWPICNLSDHKYWEIQSREAANNNSNDSSDNTFTPYLEDGGWDGKWTVPSEGKIILDKELLSFINKLLPCICIPTWIKRALPILGKASFGRLKADEWQNLFTIQLPLTLPVYWSEGGPASHSLFCNFSHLVSLVNIALKRTLTNKLIRQYRYHSLEYLRSFLILFPEVTLAPNHHMSIHLSNCLEKFGPSRAWWSFSMERLMGKISKASHNNRIGQLEITFTTNFFRIGNLQALLSQPQKFPPTLQTFIKKMKAHHDPIPVN